MRKWFEHKVHYKRIKFRMDINLCRVYYDSLGWYNCSYFLCSLLDEFNLSCFEGFLWFAENGSLDGFSE